MIRALKNSFPKSFYSQIEKRGAQVINGLRETQNALIHAVLCNCIYHLFKPLVRPDELVECVMKHLLSGFKSAKTSEHTCVVTCFRSYKTNQIELQILRKENSSLAKEQIRVETKKKV